MKGRGSGCALAQLPEANEANEALGHREDRQRGPAVCDRFSPLTARRMLKQSLEKMRLLSVSLGPLMCRTLDHLLCPAGTAVVRCSVRTRAGLQAGKAGWVPREMHGRAVQTPGPTTRKYGAEVLLWLTTAQAAIGCNPGPRSAGAEKGQQPKSARPVRRRNKRVRSLRSRPPVTGDSKVQTRGERPRLDGLAAVPAAARSGSYRWCSTLPISGP